MGQVCYDTIASSGIRLKGSSFGVFGFEGFLASAFGTFHSRTLSAKFRFA